MFQSNDQSIFFNFKSPLLLTNELFISKKLHNSFHNGIINQDPSPN